MAHTTRRTISVFSRSERFASRRRRVSCALATLLAWVALPAAADLSDDIQMLLEANTDGTVGLYLKEVNGGVLANFNENFVTYPASTIKVQPD